MVTWAVVCDFYLYMYTIYYIVDMLLRHCYKGKDENTTGPPSYYSICINYHNSPSHSLLRPLQVLAVIFSIPHFTLPVGLIDSWRRRRRRRRRSS
jgi:hypothetical protein